MASGIGYDPGSGRFRIKVDENVGVEFDADGAREIVQQLTLALEIHDGKKTPQDAGFTVNEPTDDDLALLRERRNAVRETLTARAILCIDCDQVGLFRGDDGEWRCARHHAGIGPMRLSDPYNPPKPGPAPFVPEVGS